MVPPAPSTNAPRTKGLLASEWLRGLLLVCGSLFFILCLIELPAAIGIVDYRSVLGTQFNWWPKSNRLDPQLIHVRKPYTHFSGTTRGGGITAGYIIPDADKTAYSWDDRYDHNGFRNNSDLQHADMVVLGDSMVEGMTVPQPELTTSLLAQATGKVVANLGQSAYGPQQEMVVLQRYGLPLHPEVALWIFSESTDLHDVVHYDAIMSQKPDFFRDFKARSFTHIAYVQLFHGGKLNGALRSGVFNAAGGKPIDVYFPYAMSPLTPADVGAIGETTRVIAGAQRLSAAQGTRLVFVFAPDKFRVFHSFCTYPAGSECGSWVLSDMPDRLHVALADAVPAVGYLDLTPTLVDAAAKGELPYFSDDEHWSPLGHRIAAETIESYLTQPTSAAGGHAAVRP